MDSSEGRRTLTSTSLDMDVDMSRSFISILENHQRQVESAVADQRRAIEFLRHRLVGNQLVKEPGAQGQAYIPSSGTNSRDSTPVVRDFIAEGDARPVDTNPNGVLSASSSTVLEEKDDKGDKKRSTADLSDYPARSTTDGSAFSADISATASEFVVKEDDGWKSTRPFRRVLASREFDMLCTLLMLLNILTMVIRLEFDGLRAGEEVGELSRTGVTDQHISVMDDVEASFTVWFAAELVLRYWALGSVIFKDPLGVFDIFIVVSTLVDLTLTRIFAVDGAINLSVARMIRMLKVMKFFRTFKAASAFTELRILFKTVLRSTMALIWTMVVLTMIIVAASNFQAQLLLPFIMDEGNNLETRKWVFRYYGSAARAAYTMLEATLSGGWPNYARTLVMEVHPMWALFWSCYVFCVIFAVIRVMGALFLAASLKAASEDEDTQALRRMKDAAAWTKRLRGVFVPGAKSKKDMSKLTRHHMESILKNEDSMHRLANYGYEAMEFRLLFSIMNKDESGAVEMEDFLKESLRLKGGVKAIDVIGLCQDVDRIKYMQDMIASTLSRLALQHVEATAVNCRFVEL